MFGKLRDVYYCPSNLYQCQSIFYVLAVDSPPKCGHGPVSYTHLDVYKRQALWLQTRSKAYASS